MVNVNNSENGKEDKILKGINDSKERYRKIINAGIAKWIKDFQDGRIKIETVSDLEKLVKLDIELQIEDLVLCKKYQHKSINKGDGI